MTTCGPSGLALALRILGLIAVGVVIGVGVSTGLTRRVGSAQPADAVQRVEARAPVAPPSSAPSQRRPREDAIAAGRHVIEQVQNELIKHRQEPVDSEWAPGTKALLEGDFAKLRRERRFESAAVDCRAASCSAELAWKTLSEAQDAALGLATFTYRADCTRTAFLRSETPDAEKRFHVDVFFDCKRWKAAGSKPRP